MPRCYLELNYLWIPLPGAGGLPRARREFMCAGILVFHVVSKWFGVLLPVNHCGYIRANSFPWFWRFSHTSTRDSDFKISETSFIMQWKKKRERKKHALIFSVKKEEQKKLTVWTVKCFDVELCKSRWCCKGSNCKLNSWMWQTFLVVQQQHCVHGDILFGELKYLCTSCLNDGLVDACIHLQIAPKYTFQ